MISNSSSSSLDTRPLICPSCIVFPKDRRTLSAIVIRCSPRATNDQIAKSSPIANESTGALRIVAAVMPNHHSAQAHKVDADLTEQGVMTLSGHKTPAAARLYVKRTEKQ